LFSELSGRDFTDVFVNWSAAFAVFAYCRSLHRNRVRSTLEARALFLLYCVGVLFFARAFSWLAPNDALIGELAFLPITLFPLAATLFTEALLRRHVSLVLKLYVAGGTAVFLVLDFFAGLSFTTTYLVALMIFQITTIAALVRRTVNRDRSDLSAAENRFVDVITASTALLIPLLVTDYRTVLPWMRLPRMGAIGGLLFLVAVIRSPESEARPARFLVAAAFAVVVRAVIIAAALALASERFTVEFFLDAFAISLAALLVAIVVERLRAQRLENRGSSFVRWLLRADMQSLDALMASLRELPLTEEHLLLRESDLEGYDTGAIVRLAEERNDVLSLASLRRSVDAGDSLDSAEAVTGLLEKYDMTHVVVVRRSPPTLLLLNLPLVASELYEMQLRLIQKHFRLLERLALSEHRAPLAAGA
jgi:hypothetical protein